MIHELLSVLGNTFLYTIKQFNDFLYFIHALIYFSLKMFLLRVIVRSNYLYNPITATSNIPRSIQEQSL